MADKRDSPPGDSLNHPIICISDDEEEAFSWLQPRKRRKILDLKLVKSEKEKTEQDSGK